MPICAYLAPSYYLNQCWVLSIGPLGTNVSEILIEIHFFHSQNAFGNIVCEMVAIYSKGS